MKNIKDAVKIAFLALILAMAGPLSGALGGTASGLPGEGVHPDSVKFQFDYTPEKLESALKSGKPTFLDISATWCAPCYQAAPAVEEIKKKYEGQANIMTVNYDEAKRLASKYGVRTLPSFIFFNKNGKHTEVMAGFDGKEKLEKVVDELLN